jgi:cytochrome P450
MFTIVLAAYICCFPYSEYTLSCNNVPGPPSFSLLLGNLPDIVPDQTAPAPWQWHERCGTTIRYSYFLGRQRFTTTDPRAAEYILQHTEVFVRPPQMTRVMGWAFGQGILTVEGEAHKRQRRVLAPASARKRSGR